MAGWKPHVGFQSIGLDMRYVVHELAYLGDRGGGKSVLLLADYAINIQEHPAKDFSKTGKLESGPCRPWNGILFRKHVREFETLIERSKEVLYGMFGNYRTGGQAQFLEGEHKWVFYDEKRKPYDDVSLLLVPLEHDSDIDQYVGLEWQWVGFDDLPQWGSMKPYFKIMGSMRAGKPGIPIRTRVTGNPGGRGIGEVKKHFKVPDGPKEVVRKQSMVPTIFKDEESGQELVRMFLLCLREENIDLKKANPHYMAWLALSTQGNEQLKKAWIDADFSALFGQYFTIFNPDIHRIDDPYTIFPNGRVPAHWKLYGHLDYGESAPTAFGLWAVDPEENKYLIADYYAAGEWSGFHAGAIKDLCMNCVWTGGRMPSVVFADSAIWHTRSAENAMARNRTVAKTFQNEGNLRLRPSIKGPGSRVRGWRYLKQCLAYQFDEEGKMIKKPSLYYLANCENWEHEMKNAVYSEKGDREDIDDGCADHHLTGTIYFLGGSGKPKKQDEPLPIEASYPTMKYFDRQRENHKRNKPIESFYVPGNAVRMEDFAQNVGV